PVPPVWWPRPGQPAEPSPDASATSSSLVLDAAVPFIPLADASGPSDVKLAPFTTMRCTEPAPATPPPDRCDHITFFEDALARALRENTTCAPQTTTGATVSVVMDID